MIKDMVLSVTVGTSDDATIDYAVSLAGALDAHLAGVAFLYEEVPIAMLGNDIAAQWVEGVEELRREAQRAAKSALAEIRQADAWRGSVGRGAHGRDDLHGSRR